MQYAYAILAEERKSCLERQPALAVVLGLGTARQGIALRLALPAFLQSHAANWVAAGVRLIPLGQTDAQLAIAALEEAVLQASAQAVNATIDDLGSAALMRRAVAEAAWHTSQRTAFGKHLIDQPAMTNVVADLAVESEAATVLAMRLATAVDRPDDDHERALRRIALPLAKFWVCKRTPAHIAEAIQYRSLDRRL